MLRDTVRELLPHVGNPLAPSLQDFHVYTTPAGCRAQVSDGRYTIDVPCEGPPMTVNAVRLGAVLAACPSDPVVSVAGSVVSIRAGRVRARLTVSGHTYPVATPDPPAGGPVAGLVGILARLEPYVAEDASRIWSTSVCLSGAWGYATNNVVLVRHALPEPMPVPVCLPVTVIAALKERGELTAVGYSEGSMTFHFSDGGWVRSSLVVGDWPVATVDAMLEAVPREGWMTPHPELEAMLATAAKVSTERLPVVVFRDQGLALSDDSFSAEDLGPLPEAGRVSPRMATLALRGVGGVQWHTPRQDVHAFTSGPLVGVFAGVRS